MLTKVSTKKLDPLVVLMYKTDFAFRLRVGHQTIGSTLC